MIEKIKGFDGIRGLAVLSVVLTHLGVWTALEKQGYMTHAIVSLVHGSTGVYAFFILSGFLITSLLIKEYQDTGNVSIKNFIIRRTLRIFPLYLLFLFIATLLHIFGKNVTNWRSLYYAYLYIYNFVPKPIYTSFLGHTWSLAVEEHFYLIWPLLFSICFPDRKKLVIFLLSAFIIQALVIQYYFLESNLMKQYFIGRWSFVAGYPIAAGCLAALLISSAQNTTYLRTVLNSRWLLIFGLFLYINALYLPYNYNRINHVIINADIRVIGILLILMWLFYNQDNILIKLLEWSPLKYLGTISYGVYMYQGLFLSTGPARHANQSWPPNQTIGILLLLIAAPLSYHYFEKPLLKFKNNFR